MTAKTMPPGGARAPKNRMTPDQLAHLLELMLTPRYTTKELAQLTGLAYNTVVKYTAALHARHVIHISGWKRDALGRARDRLWEFGPGVDKPRPKLTGAQKARKMRARRAAAKEAALPFAGKLGAETRHLEGVWRQ